MKKSEKERKLSKAEKRRKLEFEKISKDLALKGYNQKLIIVSSFEANYMSIILTIPLICVFLAIYLLLGNQFVLNDTDILIACGITLLLMISHEFLHGLTWSFFVKDGWKAISFGFILKSLNPYCTCSQPMKKYQIIIGALMPTLVLGIGLAIVAIEFHSTFILLISFLNMLGGGGDLLVILKLLLYKNAAREVLFIDHPYEIGTAVFEKNR